MSSVFIIKPCEVLAALAEVEGRRQVRRPHHRQLYDVILLLFLLYTSIPFRYTYFIPVGGRVLGLIQC
jgi:hypothetical protein